MILLDTHIWIWWVSNSPELSPKHKTLIEKEIPKGIVVSAISCWEIAKKVEIGKLQLDRSTDQWIKNALNYPGIQLIDLSLEILLASTQLPGNFHKDPADQMIVATSRVINVPLLTEDRKILTYPHVNLV